MGRKLWIVAAVLLLAACGRRGAPAVPSGSGASLVPSAPAATSPVVAPSDTAPRAVTLDFAGDCAFGSINGGADPLYFPAVYNAAASLTYPFDRVKDFFAADDLTVVNFECALTSAAQTGDKQWHFRGPAQYAAILPASSVEVAVLSNNHCPLDYLEQGYRDTAASLQAAGVGLVRQGEPFIRMVNGVRVVIIGDCSITGENTTVTDGVAERVVEQIRQYKTADTVVAVDMHWGSEYEAVQAWQTQAARQFIDAGADVVVGQHSHRLNGIELYRGKYIVYGLGNFAFGGNRSCPYPETAVFRIRFALSQGGVSMTGAGILPCYASSSEELNDNGKLRNNFQPAPVTGAKAQAVIDQILSQSRALADGVSSIQTYD